MNPATVTLMPGDLYFSDEDVKLVTLLGSCIAVVVWHPLRKLGGMCHFVLHSRINAGKIAHKSPHDSRYGDEAMHIFLMRMAAYASRPSEYRAWIFGGGNMLSTMQCSRDDRESDTLCAGCRNVACGNRVAARRLVNLHGMTLVACDIGGNQPRRVEFLLREGIVGLRSSASHSSAGIHLSATLK